MKVLELFSGIGGMHMALQASGVDGSIEASIDINPVANSIYKHNFPQVKLLHRNIQGLTVSFIRKLGVDTILMSPPCQPFTRNGLQADVEDERTSAFKHILNLLPNLENINKILIENVKGFECSQMRNLLIDTLKNCHFNVQEFILSPSEIGVPNSRHRYYCVARKEPDRFNFENGALRYNLPGTFPLEQCFTIGEIIEEDIAITDFLLSDKILTKYVNLLDICYSNSTNSCCFTKAYGRYVEGTGSVYTKKDPQFVHNVFERLTSTIPGSLEYLELLHSLELRYFTPKEVCRLMSFPEVFSFPKDITNKQKYMVLGNSVNVKVVAELIKCLL